MRRRDVIAALPAALTGCLFVRPDSDEETATGRTADGTETGTDATADSPTADGPTPAAPRVEWEFVQDSPRGPVTVRHVAGDALTRENTDRLELVVTTWPDHPVPTDGTLTPTRTPTTHRTTWRERSAEDAYPVRAGDAVTLTAVTPGDDVAVHWYRSRDHDGVVLGSTTVPQES